MSDVTRLLLLDDHPVILDGLSAFLASETGLEVIARCASAAEAEAALRRSEPDIAIVDVKVGDGLTFDFVAGARAAFPALRVVFVTGYEDDLYVERAFESGALGYVLKNEPLTEVVAAVRAAERGERYLSPQMRQRFPQSGAADGADAPQTRLSLLTRREREILQHVSHGRSAKEISEILKISTWTVTNHKANIMAKLGIHNQVGLTRFAVSTGLVSL